MASAVEAVLGGGLEGRAVIFGRLVDLLQFPQAQKPQAQKPAQVVGIGHVAFAAIPTDEEVLPRVAHQRAVDVGVERAGCPSGQLARLHGEALLLCIDRRDPGNQLRFSRGKLLVALVGAVGGHHAESRGICMEVESEVCCSHKGVCGGVEGADSLQYSHHRRPFFQCYPINPSDMVPPFGWIGSESSSERRRCCFSREGAYLKGLAHTSHHSTSRSERL